MLRIFIFASLLLCCGLQAGIGIVLPETPNAFEQMAAQELAEHFELATGKKFTISNGTATLPRNIYIGSHPKVKAVVGDKQFQPEEWLVQAVDKDTLLITGGLPRGVIYAAYEFLENNLGVLWLDEWSTHVPKAAGITWSADLKYSGVPSFPVRGVYPYFGANRDLRHKLYARNRMNHFHDEKVSYGPAWERGVSSIVGSPRSCHTFYLYTKDWGPDKEKLFAWSSSRRQHLRATSPSGPGQVCYSNPETVRLFVEQLEQFIQGDVKRYGADRAPWIYAIAANDNGDHCQCEGCLALVKKYRGQSGALIYFVNAIAEKIAPRHPRVKLMTMAYMNAKEPPQGIEPHKNVIIQIALLGSEYSGEHRDTHRPYTAPANRDCDRLIKEWQKRAPLAIWDYWSLNADRGIYPSTNAVNLAESLQYYKNHNVQFVFAECPGYTSGSLHALRLYLGVRMMCKANLDAKAEIARFINAYYGKAAPMLQAYHDYLQLRNGQLKGSLCDVPLNRRTDLDATFFQKAQAWLTDAEKAEQDNPVVLQRIRREWVPVYRAMLDKRQELNLPREEVKTLAKKLQEYETAAIRTYMPEPRQVKEIAKLDVYVRGILADVPPLKGFEGKDVIADYTWPVLSQHRNTSVIDDPEAAGGKAVGFIGKEGRSEAERKKHQENRGIHAGIYDFSNRYHLTKGQLAKQGLPTDEKYHWYFVGRFELREKAFLWMHWSWLSQQQLRALYDPSGLNNLIDVYVSIKVQGPNYVPGSTKSDAYAIDRVVICRSTNQPDPSMLPLPKGFQGRQLLFELSAISMGEALGITASYDADAINKTARRLGKKSTHVGRELQIGLYDEIAKQVTNRVRIKNVPQDEKFHAYSLGVRTIPARGYIFAHSSCLLRVNMSSLYSKLDADKAYEIVVVVKAEGPAYVKGSKREDAVSIERILLLAPEGKDYSKVPVVTALPQELQGRTCAAEVSGQSLGVFRNLRPKADADSPTGISLRLTKQSSHLGRPFQVGMYDSTRKAMAARIHPKPLPQDEKYHPYSLGVHKIPSTGYIFAHSSGLLRVDLRQVLGKCDPNKKYEVVVMVKLEGSAYVSGSSKEDAVSIDRILLLEPKN